MRQIGAFVYRDEWPTLPEGQSADSSRQLHGSTRPSLRSGLAHHSPEQVTSVARNASKGSRLLKEESK